MPRDGKRFFIPEWFLCQIGGYGLEARGKATSQTSARKKDRVTGDTPYYPYPPFTSSGYP